MMMPVLYRRFRIMKHANFLLAFAFYQREPSTLLLDQELFFLSFFLFSRYNVAVRGGRAGKRQGAHRVCKYIHVFTNTHRVWKVSGRRGGVK